MLKKVEIKDRIREAMESRGLTQSELSERAKIDKGQLSSYLSGKYKPRQKNIEALAHTLNVSEAWLMGYEDPNIVKFDNEIDEIIDILTKDHYRVEYSPSDGSDAITILNGENNVVTCIRDFELVNIYESLKRSNSPITSNSLLDPNSDPAFQHMESFAYRSIGISYINNYLSFDCTNIINALSLLNYAGFKEAEKRIVELQYIPQYKASQTHDFSDIITVTTNQVFKHDSTGNVLNAAHERTDVEVTDEMRKHDDDLMDGEW